MVLEIVYIEHISLIPRPSNFFRVKLNHGTSNLKCRGPNENTAVHQHIPTFEMNP